MLASAEDSDVWIEQLRIHSYEVDFNQRGSLESLCRLFLEGAWNRAEHLGVGFHQLASQKKFWVLSRMAVEVEQFPRKVYRLDSRLLSPRFSSRSLCAESGIELPG
jgi:hypothetical protein